MTFWMKRVKEEGGGHQDSCRGMFTKQLLVRIKKVNKASQLKKVLINLTNYQIDPIV